MSSVEGSSESASAENSLLSEDDSAKGGGDVPTGNALYARLAQLLVSKEANALDELKALAAKVASSKPTPTSQLWDEGDEMLEAGVPGGRPSLGTAKKFPAGMGAPRVVKIDAQPLEKRKERMHVSAPAAKKHAPSKDNSPAATPKIVIELSEDDDEETDKKERPTGSSASIKGSGVCSRCQEGAEAPRLNPMLTCESCGSAFHAKCHRPEVSKDDFSDQRYLFICSTCTNVKRFRPEGSASPRPTSASTSSTASSSPAPPKKKKEALSSQQAAITAQFEAFKKKREKQLSMEQIRRK